MNMTSATQDFKWVLKVLKSSKSKEHLETTLKCFTLWEGKHISEKLSNSDEESIKHLRYQFWCLFRNKSSRYEVERR
jgi:hypothetical protein